MLFNIINNARDIIVQRNITSGKIFITEEHDRDEVVLKISDNAGGVNPEILHKIFEPYFTTREKGTGIGLYTSKKILEHGSLHRRRQFQ